MMPIPEKAVTVGLTGLTGAGKSTVARLLAERGFKVIDADRQARSVTEKGSPALELLAQRFGKDILLEDGSLDRRKLAARAFSSKENTQALNEITHPLILRLMKKQADELLEQGCSVVLDAPLLFECSLEKICDYTVTAVCPEDIRIKRLQERDGISKEDIQKRMNAQSPQEYQSEKSDFVIVNDGNTQLADLVEELIAKIKAGTAQNKEEQ